MLSMTDRLKRKKQKFNEIQDRYINCDFILGSVAEVERRSTFFPILVSLPHRLRSGPYVS